MHASARRDISNSIRYRVCPLLGKKVSEIRPRGCDTLLVITGASTDYTTHSSSLCHTVTQHLASFSGCIARYDTRCGSNQQSVKDTLCTLRAVYNLHHRILYQVPGSYFFDEHNRLPGLDQGGFSALMPAKKWVKCRVLPRLCPRRGHTDCKAFPSDAL